jgi:hypothetical protein
MGQVTAHRQLLAQVRDAGNQRMQDREEWLLQLAESHESSAIRRSALVALRKLQSTKVWPILINILATEVDNENLRETAIKCLGEIGDRATEKILLGLSESESLSRFGKQAAKNALALLRSKDLQRDCTEPENHTKPAQRHAVLKSIARVRMIVADFSQDLDALEKLLEIDVGCSLNKIRCVTERVLHSLCKHNGVSWGHEEPTLERMIGPLVATKHIPRNVALHVRTIQTNASPGSHYQESPLSDSHVTIALMAFVDFLTWFGTVAEPSAAADGGRDPGS